jgi:diguanylate cyclase (GGDEF)-like protein
VSGGQRRAASMRSRAILHFSPHGRQAPEAVRAYVTGSGHDLLELRSRDEVLVYINRTYPLAVVIDGYPPADAALETCRIIKEETFTAVVPVITYVDGDGAETAEKALEGGADEVLTPALSVREWELRLRMAILRADRDVSVHPTTRLPGTVQIERDIAERLRSDEPFACCYADLDHFKEFNDRYGYNHGDRVILILSRILRDVVRGHSRAGFVGHIGGDDFIFNVPLADLRPCCEDILDIFNELMPFQYSEEDRARGYFLGKDRRGEEYQVPLMTLSIGVVTNEHRKFHHPAEISELATEMKTYAKSLPGSLFVVDRRRNLGDAAT